MSTNPIGWEPGPFNVGDEVIVCGGHPWRGHSGTLQAYEQYGFGWRGWRVALICPSGQQCYASPDQLQAVRA
jgi:hypothetical protein